MEKAKIEIGFRVGMLEVTKATAERKNGYTVWRCRCDCGNERLLDTRALQRGTVTDCGCRSKVPPGANDLTGRRFGKLTVLEPTGGRQYGGLVWQCRCDCGNTVPVSAHQLLAGYTKSCGCLSHPPIKDFVGQRFGSLTVLAYDGKWNGMHRWRCRCDCGNETVVGQSLLQNGKTKSCGCLQNRILLENLKLVDHTSVTLLESRKDKCSRANTSGQTGVYRHKKTGKWIAQITFQGKTRYLGSYETFEEAVKARQKGEELHDDFLRQYHAEHPNEENSS